MNHRTCEPIRDIIGPVDVAAAYEVQQLVNGRRLSTGVTAVGRKIGLTSEAVQRQLKVDQPDFGVLFSDMLRRSGDEVALDSLLQPRVEAEVAFVLARDLDEGPFTVSALADAIDYALPAIEIVDSRVRDWNIALTDTVADNASSGLFVLGTEPMAMEELVPRRVRMQMWMDDVVVSTGSGEDCLGDPLLALAWLAATCLDLGAPLLRGETILSGALGPLVPVSAACAVRAELQGLGTVFVNFVDA